jgi:F-type H+-transporting ATPase subunit delta
MRGVSRASLAEAEERLEPLTGPQADAAGLGGDLFAVAGLLSGAPALRRALTDPSRPPRARSGLVTRLLDGRVSQDSAGLVAAMAGSRWSAPGDLVEAIEQLAVEAVTAAADQAGRLDELEDELFRFGRIVRGQPDLRAALTNPFADPDGKRRLIGELLAGKVSPEALRLIEQAATNPLGRSLDASLEDYARIAAQRRERLVAEVHVAVPLTDAQRGRLAAALTESYGHRVHLNMVLDPRLTGGMTIQVGEELIDASVATRLAEARRRLAG